MSELGHLTPAMQRRRSMALEALCRDLSAAEHHEEAHALRGSRTGYVFYTDLSLEEWASAVCGADMRDPKGYRCSHWTQEFVVAGMKCPHADASGECCECPF